MTSPASRHKIEKITSRIPAARRMKLNADQTITRIFILDRGAKRTLPERKLKGKVSGVDGV
jgi:hypothetical protein